MLGFGGARTFGLVFRELLGRQNGVGVEIQVCECRRISRILHFATRFGAGSHPFCAECMEFFRRDSFVTIGVQFSEQDQGNTQKKIENYLAGALGGDKPTHTI